MTHAQTTSPAPARKPHTLGMRHDHTWRRERAERTAAAELSTRELIAAHEGSARHSHVRKWTDRDRALAEEVKARAWGMPELSRLRDTRIPRWADPILRDASPTGRHRAAWGPFVAWLLAAYAAGALGLLLSYDELAAELGIGRRTWARYVRELKAAGIVRVTATWAEPTDGREALRNRERARNLYTLGAAFEGFEAAALEAAPALDTRARGRARKAAAAARRSARGFRREAELRIRDAAHGEPSTASLIAPLEGDAPPGECGAVPVGREHPEGGDSARGAAAKPRGACIESAKLAPQPARGPVPLRGTGTPGTAGSKPAARPYRPGDGATRPATPSGRAAQFGGAAPLAESPPSGCSRPTGTAPHSPGGASPSSGATPAHTEPVRTAADPGGGRGGTSDDAPRPTDAIAALRAALEASPRPTVRDEGPAPRGESARDAARRSLGAALEALEAAARAREGDPEGGEGLH